MINLINIINKKLKYNPQLSYKNQSTSVLKVGLFYTPTSKHILFLNGFLKLT